MGSAITDLSAVSPERLGLGRNGKGRTSLNARNGGEVPRHQSTLVCSAPYRPFRLSAASDTIMHIFRERRLGGYIVLRFAVLAVATLLAFEPAYAAQSQLSARLSFPSDKALKDYSPSEAMKILEIIWKSKDPALPDVVSDAYKIYAFYNRKIINDAELNEVFIDVVQKIYTDKASQLTIDMAIELACKDERESTQKNAAEFRENVHAVFRERDEHLKKIQEDLKPAYERAFNEMQSAPKLRCIELVRAKDWVPPGK